MTDFQASRRSFLRRAFAGVGAIAVAGPELLAQLDQLPKRTYVDFGRRSQWRVVSIIHDSVVIEVPPGGEFAAMRALAKSFNFGWPNGGGIFDTHGLLAPGTVLQIQRYRP